MAAALPAVGIACEAVVLGIIVADGLIDIKERSVLKQLAKDENELAQAKKEYTRIKKMAEKSEEQVSKMAKSIKPTIHEKSKKITDEGDFININGVRIRKKHKTQDLI